MKMYSDFALFFPTYHSPHHNADVPCYGKQNGTRCESEDCLNVNVYCPTAPSPDGKGYATMFWIFGGAFDEGFNAGPLNLYDGAEMASQGRVCVVATNYRLGVLGFAVLGETASGNQAIQDQRAAMVWTRDNIAAFGGDPGSVTIWGESAGAMSVSVHLVSPASQGLFHRAVMESNVASFRYTTADHQALTFGAEFTKLTNCSQGDLKCLRGLSPRDVIVLGEKAAGSVRGAIVDRILEGGHIEDALAMQWSPVIDEHGDDLPGLPLEQMTAGKWSPVPVLLGSNQDEGATFVYAGIKSKLPDMLGPVMIDAIFGKDGKKVWAFYSDVAKSWYDTRDLLSYVLTDYWFKCSAYRIAALTAAAGLKAFVYRFSHVVSFSEVFTQFGIPTICENRTCHMTEIPFVYDNTALNFTFTEAEKDLSAAMLRYWTSFARNGDPNDFSVSDGVTWPSYNDTKRINLKLSTPIVTESTTSGQHTMTPGTVPAISPRGVCEFFDSIGYKW